MVDVLSRFERGGFERGGWRRGEGLSHEDEVVDVVVCVLVVVCCGVGGKGSGGPSGERWREGRTGHRPARDKKFPGKGGAKAGLGSPQKRGLSHPVGGPGTGRDRYYQSNRNGWLTMLFTSHLAVQPSYAYLLPLRFHPEITMAS